MRDIALLTPELRDKYYEFEKEMRAAGIEFIVTSTARNLDEQMALYVQGRAAIGLVNILRKAVDLSPISDKNNRPVTWTLKSKHVIRPGMFARAFDIALIENGKVTWELKVDVNKNDIPDYREAGLIGERVGLKWGGRFLDSQGKPNPDYPHFEI